MKRKTANSRRLDIFGNGSQPSALEILTATLKRYRRSLGYFSIFATLPALLLSNNQEARMEDVKPTDAMAPEDTARLGARLKAGKTSELLKRQSKFRLPHQTNLGFVPAQADYEDCPGRAIAAGSYPAVAPYIAVGDTTGSSNSVNAFYMYSFGYRTVSSPAPDHVYSFILTDRGPNPRIEVSTTSATLSPMIYLLEGGIPNGCPAGTSQFAWNGLMYAESTGGVATINEQLMNFLPLHVPLYLFIDSGNAGATGPYTLKVQDVTIAPMVSNAIDDPGFFVRQQYFDFLNRQPEAQGFNDWMNVLNSCNGDSNCLYGPSGKRTLVSQDFFGSQEFNLKGGYVFRFYKASLARFPTFNEMAIDMYFVAGQTADEVNQKRAQFASKWVLRTDFLNSFPRSLTPSQFVDNVSQTAGITLSNRSQIISDLAANNTDAGRAVALRAIVDSQEEQNHEFNSAFVYMQYVGYLRRDPDANGYNDWLTYLNTHPGDFNTMVWGFVDSTEYRKRFGP